MSKRNVKIIILVFLLIIGAGTVIWFNADGIDDFNYQLTEYSEVEITDTDSLLSEDEREYFIDREIGLINSLLIGEKEDVESKIGVGLTDQGFLNLQEELIASIESDIGLNLVLGQPLASSQERIIRDSF